MCPALLQASLCSNTTMFVMLQIQWLWAFRLLCQIAELELSFVVFDFLLHGFVLLLTTLCRACLIDHQNFLNTAVYRHVFLVVDVEDKVDKFVILRGQQIIRKQPWCCLWIIIVFFKVNVFCPLVRFPRWLLLFLSACVRKLLFWYNC